MTTDPVGTLAEEAAKLLAAVHGWASDHQGAGPGAGSDESAAAHERHEAPGHDPLSAECRYCPFCALARAAKAASPEVRDHLASAALSFALAVKGLVDQTSHPTGDPTPVEKIDLAED